MALNARKASMNNAYSTLLDVNSDNDKAPVRALYIETPSDSSNPTTFKVTHFDGLTQEITLGPGESIRLEQDEPERKRITKLEGKRATEDQASTATHRTITR